ncbi:polar-differentiation response regulator DivK [Clostridium puniceum]|uniref:Stage 0 sporulation protein A homolog n=1 Tax=Clostridium puniceum TaxID=29367 RepID=A0A1S8TLD7_9CLOT|nr:response regulator [Clostridium puniceum]OOM78506.1 polar-differentiation response regulator DivK [Clostridium puniceum]
MVIDKLTPKILIIDDNTANILLLSKMLKIAAYNNIKTLTDSREILDTLSVYMPDLILLDFRMPFIDGLEVINILNSVKDYKNIPIIMISAENDKKYYEKALANGAIDFITKPFNYNDIVLKIEKTLHVI